MKKTVVFIFSLVLIIALVGCTGKSDTDVKEQYTIGIAQFGEHASLDNCREGLLQGLEEEGFVEGENLIVEYENAQFDTAITNQIASRFTSKGVDMIAAIATPMAQSAYNAANGTDIPVVFTAVTDPDVAMLTEGNVTGTSDKLPVEAQLKLIRAMMPDAENIGILYTTSEVNSESTIAEYKELAGEYGFNIIEQGVSVAADIPLAVDKLLPKVDCLNNLTDNTVVGSLPVILEKSKAQDIPVFGSEIEQVKLGCIASEGIEYIGLGKQTGKIAALILRGEKSAEEIPYEIIEESVLYVNSSVMTELGLTLPDEMVERATDVVQ